MTSSYRDSVAVTLRTGREVRAVVRRHRDHGAKAPSCVLLHGNPGSLLDWEKLVEPLSAVANVAVIDMAGFGRSARPAGAPSALDLDHLAADAVAVGKALSWSGPVFLVGHSHGGGVAQVAAANHPGAVAGIVLIATLGSPTHRSYRLLSLPGAHAVVRFRCSFGRCHRISAGCASISASQAKNRTPWI